MKVEFKQGRMVKEGDVLVQIDPRPYQAALDQALSKKAQDEANLKNAKLNLDRYTTLAEKDYASKQQVDTQRALVEQLTAQVDGDQAAIENAQTQLSYTTIKAPISGRAGFRLVDRGNIVHASDQSGIVMIVQLQPISVVFTAPEEEVEQINKALEEGTVPVKALSSDGLRVLAQGRLARVNNEVDMASGTIRMKAVFENKDNVLWPGLSVATRLLVETLKQVAVVPDDAVLRGPNGLYVYVVGDDNKVSVQSVTVSHSGEGNSVVTQGLTPGQTVVVAGQYRLQPGSLVQRSEPKEPKEAAIPPKAP
jgi:multidrug efflux system membrane fusion protein